MWLGTTGSQNQWRSSGMTLLLLETKWPIRRILLQIIITESRSVFSKNHHYVVRTWKVVGESVAVRRTDGGCCCCYCCGSMRVIAAFCKFAVVTVCEYVSALISLSEPTIQCVTVNTSLLVFVLRYNNIVRKRKTKNITAHPVHSSVLRTP